MIRRKSFVVAVVLLTLQISSSRRHRGKTDYEKDDTSLNHPHRTHQHNRGVSGPRDDNNGSSRSPDGGAGDCLDGRHFPFKRTMPISDSPEKDAEDDSDDDFATEIRINKYYAVRRDRFYIRNTGSSLEFRLQPNQSKTDARIRGEDWDDEYILAKGVFHWQLKNLTAKNPDGTTVFNTDSADPPLEMELVHYGSKFNSLEEATKDPQGILVTGHLFELVGRDNPALEPLARSALSTTFPTDAFKQVHGPLDIKLLFPSELSYFEYLAMYPLNPCANQAKFIVFKKPLFVSARQLKRFGGLRTEDGVKISDKLGATERKETRITGSPKSSTFTIYLSIMNTHSLPSHSQSIHTFEVIFYQVISCAFIFALMPSFCPLTSSFTPYRDSKIFPTIKN